MVGALLLYLLLVEQFETICTFRRAQVRLSKYAAVADKNGNLQCIPPFAEGGGGVREGKGDEAVLWRNVRVVYPLYSEGSSRGSAAAN